MFVQQRRNLKIAQIELLSAASVHIAVCPKELSTYFAHNLFILYGLRVVLSGHNVFDSAFYDSASALVGPCSRSLCGTPHQFGCRRDLTPDMAVSSSAKRTLANASMQQLQRRAVDDNNSRDLQSYELWMIVEEAWKLAWTQA